jgi:hypothetical protein
MPSKWFLTRRDARGGAFPPRQGRSHPWCPKSPLGDREDAFAYLARHATGDWAELCAFDRRQNEVALREGYRVLSSYQLGEGSIWIITETDRSVTTVLLPEEY